MRLNRWFVLAVLTFGLGIGCSESNETNTNGPKTGKGDEISCAAGTYGLNGVCVSPEQACEGSGGVWDSAETNLELACTCLDIRFFDERTGLCELPVSAACEETGGTEFDWGCFCGADSYYIASEGLGCVSDGYAQSVCEGSGGAWTETPNFEEASMNAPTERNYCACAEGYFEPYTGACVSLKLNCESTDGSWDDAEQTCTCLDIRYADESGYCVLPQDELCEETGGTLFDWGCFCGADSYYVPTEGGCIQSAAAEALCEGSDGTWTQTPNFEEASMNAPTERHYCACDNGYYEYTEGVCKS